MSVLIAALAAGLLTHFFPCCAFAIRSFSKVSATPAKDIPKKSKKFWGQGNFVQANCSIEFRMALKNYHSFNVFISFSRQIHV